ncbi:hypothetical protein EX30DRAFT_240437 [Ascodesmis nigricans]|uniref:HCP-like protein n=1 Tax=Ascodesmis nigricans TaxID=341454 RepID=A0A4S2MZ85_9PEZI|nr:hypothetical protein EX30DRAFT_240437 [Ascodesmis nigricans]
MQAGPGSRPTTSRSYESSVTAFRHHHEPGDLTPEISPLDQFIYRNQLRVKELKHSESQHPGVPRRGSDSGDGDDNDPSTPVPRQTNHHNSSIEEDGVPAGMRMMQDGRTPPPPLMMPRFSTVSSVDSERDRDSMISDTGSTIMGAFSFGFETMRAELERAQNQPQQQYKEYRGNERAPGPPLQQQQHAQYNDRPMMRRDADMPPLSSNLHQIRMLANSDQRGSLIPSIETASTAGDSRPNSMAVPTTHVTAPSPRFPPPTPEFAQGLGPRGRNREERRPSPERYANQQQQQQQQFNRSMSQPGYGKRPPPVRQASGDNIPQRGDPRRGGDGIMYKPYRQEGGNDARPREGSTSSDRFGPPSRTGTGGSDKSGGPPPTLSRENTGGSERLLPYRQPSTGEQQRRPYPPRQGSGDSVHRGPQMMRQDSQDGRYRRGSPSPHLPAILPMRVASPDIIDGQDSKRRPSHSHYSPVSPIASNMERSASAASDHNSIRSTGDTLLPKPQYNFSRPISRGLASDGPRPTIDIHSYHNLTPEQLEQLPTPVPGKTFDEPTSPLTSDIDSAPPATTIYSRFTLPRGRNLTQRDSVIFQDAPPDLETLHQVVTGQHQSSTPSATPRPTGPSRSISQPTRNPASKPNPPRPQTSKGPPNTHLTPHLPKTPRNPVPAAAMSPDEHLDLGISLHEKGSLQESTYHLRCAAHGGHPTGMLLYALACRHGWGMRPNQKEGVSWLKKVTQIASTDVAEMEKRLGGVVGGKGALEKQAMRAQFALSIYELGISHLNGWGTEVDKALALNCFEIAGKWGDPDALSEAGFCYANGVGAKKDMKKAAKYYRMAEAKGANMVGNSWIWKDKYLDDEDRMLKNGGKGGKGGKGKEVGESPGREKEGKQGRWGRKKSFA